MKTIKQELPKAQIDIIVQALSIREQDLQRYLQNLGVTEEDSTSIQYELFDILVLKKMLAYKVEISLTQPQVEYFTSINGVDYPMYDIEPIITDGVRVLSQIERDLLYIKMDLLEELYKDKDGNSLAQIESYDNEFINIVINFDLDSSKNIILYRNTMKVFSK